MVGPLLFDGIVGGENDDSAPALFGNQVANKGSARLVKACAGLIKQQERGRVLDGEGKAKPGAHSAGELPGGLVGRQGDPIKPNLGIAGVTAQFGGEYEVLVGGEIGIQGEIEGGKADRLAEITG